MNKECEVEMKPSGIAKNPLLAFIGIRAFFFTAYSPGFKKLLREYLDALDS